MILIGYSAEFSSREEASGFVRASARCSSSTLSRNSLRVSMSVSNCLQFFFFSESRGLR